MSNFMLHFLDWFFFIFHFLFVIFVLTGWIWKKTRPWNLVCILLTLSSWFLLGLIYGIGFCPFTEWHWQILDRLGRTNLPDSYISYLLIRSTGLTLPQNLVDTATVLGGIISFIISLVLNIRDRIKSKNKNK